MKRFHQFFLPFFVLISILGFTSCSSNRNSDSSSDTVPSDSSSTTVVVEKRFESITEMRDLFIEVGGSCPSWKQENQVTLALETGSCSESNVMSIYSSRAVAEEQNRAYKKFVLDVMPSWVQEDRPISLLVGANWILNETNSTTVGAFQAAFGGDLITSYNDIP
jgi:hypothetical protein